MSRGPKKSGFNPVKEYYRCPVKNCNSQFRGDEISRHFTKNANLDLLREALENQSNLRKNLPPGKVVANSDEFLKNLLAQVSNSEKVHTEYLFQNGHTLEQLPKCNSINFKCQQEKEKRKKRPAPLPGFFLLPKKSKFDGVPVERSATLSGSNCDNAEVEPEPKSPECGLDNQFEMDENQVIDSVTVEITKSIDPLPTNSKETQEFPADETSRFEVDENVWTVKDVSVFLKYCCPECDYNNINLEMFKEHALEKVSFSDIFLARYFK
jgi:hypothetical protein